MTAAPERDLDLVLARLHLRTGSLGLARAELEALAGVGALDDEGLADLAEARWRTGDLAGAGDAAQAHLASGGDALVALVVAAEATAALGRPGEARSLAGRALEQAQQVDPVFAGMPRSPIWPQARVEDERTDGSDGSDDRDGADGDRDHAGTSPDAPAPDGTAVTEHPTLGLVPLASRTPGATDADAALAAGRAAVEAGDLAGAAIQLAVALRLAPLLAPAVLEAAATHRSPGLDLVRGDALSALGHESEARRAWAEAAAAARD
ncbi:MAG TPA: hypothetical protein VFR14_03600 [Candidatus Limnocylindrales bacterium]|nr:hypothetical protein [Candidatus Limnocylindrales bacterium]